MMLFTVCNLTDEKLVLRDLRPAVIGTQDLVLHSGSTAKLVLRRNTRVLWTISPFNNSAVGSQETVNSTSPTSDQQQYLLVVHTTPNPFRRGASIISQDGAARPWDVHQSWASTSRTICESDDKLMTMKTVCKARRVDTTPSARYILILVRYT
jgi:hypothetical protein